MVFFVLAPGFLSQACVLGERLKEVVRGLTLVDHDGQQPAPVTAEPSYVMNGWGLPMAFLSKTARQQDRGD